MLFGFSASDRCPLLLCPRCEAPSQDWNLVVINTFVVVHFELSPPFVCRFLPIEHTSGGDSIEGFSAASLSRRGLSEIIHIIVEFLIWSLCRRCKTWRRRNTVWH